MKIDKKRLNRQLEAGVRWKRAGYNGTFLWTTGTGKSYLAILCLKHLLKTNKNLKTIIVVPSDYLRTQWRQHVKDHNLPNILIETVNSLITKQWEVDLVIYDEIHSYTGGEKFSMVFDCIKRQYTIGLSATLRDNPEENLVINRNCPVVDELPLKEALDNNYVSPFTVYNLGIELTDSQRKQYSDIHKQFIKYFSTFNFNLSMMFAAIANDDICKEIARNMRWKPEMVKVHALQANRTMQKRKALLYSNPQLNDVAVNIIEKFPGKKTITFHELTSQADELNIRLLEKGIKSRTYHSSMPTLVYDEEDNLVAYSKKITIKKKNKTVYIPLNTKDEYSWKELKKVIGKKITRISGNKQKSQIMEDYNNGKVDVINTATSLNEGADIDGLELSIVCSFNSSTIASLQRTGRTIRKAEGKRAIEVNIYIKDTQSEKWLTKKQILTPNVKWITNVNEIV